MRIPAVQSGLFKDVRACMDAAALLVVTPPEGRTPIVITSLNAVDSATGRRSASAGSAPLNTEGADETARRVVTAGGTDVDGKVYVAVRAGARLSDLSFEIRTSCISGMLKGIPEPAGAEVAVSGGVYFIGADGWHDYIVADGRKWATMNVGATSRSGRESFGHFFSWGNVVGYNFSGVDWKVAPGYPYQSITCIDFAAVLASEPRLCRVRRVSPVPACRRFSPSEIFIKLFYKSTFLKTNERNQKIQ